MADLLARARRAWWGWRWRLAVGAAGSVGAEPVRRSRVLDGPDAFEGLR